MIAFLIKIFYYQLLLFCTNEVIENIETWNRIGLCFYRIREIYYLMAFKTLLWKICMEKNKSSFTNYNYIFVFVLGVLILYKIEKWFSILNIFKFNMSVVCSR